MGTPEFAVPSLASVLDSGYEVAGVITAPDRPSGRGQKLRPSPVKVFAEEKGLKILQPTNLKDPVFIEELRSLEASLQVVVAFRMLPEVVWKMPPLGTFNLHASLLPQYRGAAPIHHAIMNGETETGVTTFFLRQEIDTGKIIFREKTGIGPRETFGELHDRLKDIGARVVVKTIRAIEAGEAEGIPQERLTGEGTHLKMAPKIFREDCRIDWSLPAATVFNKIRGLSPFPAAFTTLVNPAGEIFELKVFRAELEERTSETSYPELICDGKTFLSVKLRDGTIRLTEVQLAGKKKMSAPELLRGFEVGPGWKIGSQNP